MKIHYDEASEPYAVTLGEETYYYIRNAVGDVKGLINADTGEYVYALNTSAYGVLNFIEPDLTFDTSSLLPDQITQIVRMMKKLVLQMCLCLPTANTYKGYSYDFFTGLYYLQSRYYDPEVGRFINADDVDYLGASGKPLSYNLFAYCENNPVKVAQGTVLCVLLKIKIPRGNHSLWVNQIKYRKHPLGCFRFYYGFSQLRAERSKQTTTEIG